MEEKGGQKKYIIVCNGLILGFLDSGYSKIKFQAIYQSFRVLSNFLQAEVIDIMWNKTVAESKMGN